MTSPAAGVHQLTTSIPEPTGRLPRFLHRQAWTTGVAILLVLLVLWRTSQVPHFGDFEIRTITAGAMSLAFLAMAQALVVISGGIDLSVGAMLVFTNCLSALWMEGKGLGACLGIAVAVVAIAIADVDADRRDHHGVGCPRHHRHAGGEFHDLRTRATRDQVAWWRSVARLPETRRRRPR